MSREPERHGLARDAMLVMDAIALIRLGARLQLLQSEVALPHDRLVRLYREVRGVPPTKGLLPFSADWYMTWMANLHASLFHGIYRFLLNEAGCRRLDALVKAYGQYLACCESAACSPALDLTRAWTLVRFVDGGILDTMQCVECGARFIRHRHDSRVHRRCVACHLPARAGKRAGAECADALQGPALAQADEHAAWPREASRNAAWQATWRNT
ncbi:FlhC family transcriptional regulator [Burkholderia gladioli]|uniref:FlhC family transcriptional regulator n=1 Tax=Burkholderia gladioli TaxID=28095 RepID=UPI00163FD3E0|nr:FlhC family transcriptional regulator [Burkholderia gladioli]